MMTKTRYYALLCGLLLVAVAYAFSSSDSDPKPKKIIVVGDKSYAPFEFLDENGQPQGIFVDIWKLWEQKTGIAVEYRMCAWNEAIALVDSGEADAFSGFFYSSERAQKYLYSEPYYQIETHIFFARELTAVRNLYDIRPWPVGVVQGDLAEEFLIANGLRNNITLFASYQDMITAAVAGEVSVFICDTPIALYHLARSKALDQFRHADEPLYSNEVYAGVRHGENTLREYINAGLVEISDREIEAVGKHWLGVAAKIRFPWKMYASVGILLIGMAILIAIRNRYLQRQITHTESALQESQFRYRDLVENLNDVVFEVNAKGILQFVNSAVESIGNYRIGDLIGHPFSDFVHPDDLLPLKKSIDEALQGATSIMEFRILAKNGTIRWMRASSRPIYRHDKAIGLRGILMDITQNRAYEEALQKSELKYRSLVEYSNDAIYLMYNRRFEMVNEKFLQLFELRESDVKNPTFSILDIVRFDYHEAILERQQKMESGEPIDSHIEFWGQTKSGREILLEGSISVIHYEKGFAAQGFLRDVTRRRNLEEQLIQAQKMEAVGQLAGGIAHDFNNLLTVINGCSELLLQKITANNPYYNQIYQIHQAGISAAALTRQLLAFSRKQVIQKQIINLQELLQSLQPILHRLIGETICFELQIQPQLKQILADPGQIEQILLNLCVNARDAMPLGGKIVIELQNVFLEGEMNRRHQRNLQGEFVQMIVSDTGMGMDRKTQERIFEPFFTTKESGKGTGLGLATVYGIVVEQCQGHIWVYSEPGKGTTFKLYFPAISQTQSQQAKAVSASQSLWGNETIAVIEDDSNVRSFIAITLENFGYRVLEAEDGYQAMKMLQETERKIDLIITDIIMPGMNGKEVVKEIEHLYPALKVVYMSGYTNEIVVAQGFLEEDMQFLQKPFSPMQLLEKVRISLDN